MAIKDGFDLVEKGVENMYCTLKNNEVVDIEHNGNTYMCGKNCGNQESRCVDCGYEDCHEGCEVYDLLGSCDKCDLWK